MNITNQQINGTWCEVFLSTVKSNYYLLSLHGIGEESQAGVTDGSQLQKEEVAGLWITAARAGVELPFNIVAPQIDNAKYSDWWHIINGAPGNESWLVNYIKENLEASLVGVTGYSLGGRGCWNLLRYDTKKYLNFIAPVCGYYDFSEGPIANLRTVPVYGVHGDKDTTMPYNYDTATQTAYSVGRPTQKINGVDRPCYYLVTIPGVAHNVWPIAYDLTPGKDGLYQWVIQQFGIGNIIQPSPIIYPATITFDGTDFISTANGVSKKLVTK